MAYIAEKPQPFLHCPARPAISWRKLNCSFETYLIAAGCEKFSPRGKAAFLKTFLGAEANRTARMIESARPACASTGNDYEYLVQGLVAHFDVSTSQRANRIQFRSLCQAETESAIDFARCVQYVGRQCNFGSDEVASLVDQPIVGLASDHTRERLLTEGPALTSDKAIQIIQNVTVVQDLMQRYRATREEIVQAIDKAQRTRPLRFPNREFRSATFRINHRSSPPTTCGRCYRTWHKLQQCPTRFPLPDFRPTMSRN
ncbi:hypothetical protein HPB48_017027 [Haemaphysalis longicornis]|uniref:Uncharacterized protein n=1 Tax=Haemaphysalis longicornis TaxID=44386 RepID=A0A9J6GIP3_HAELO|nr:hypothetical protein HPB48_017027 [Haemaphysalis longicornis]